MMRFISILLVLFAIMPLFGFQKPTSIKVNYPAISVRETHLHTSNKIGIVYANREYPVLDIIFSYYKIEMPNQTYGWVYGHPKKNTIEFDSQKMVLKCSTTVSVRSEKNSKSKRIAITSPNIEYKVVDYYMSHIKVIGENKIEGWIYTGNFQNSWTSLSNSLNTKEACVKTNNFLPTVSFQNKTEKKPKETPKVESKCKNKASINNMQWLQPENDRVSSASIKRVIDINHKPFSQKDKNKPTISNNINTANTKSPETIKLTAPQSGHIKWEKAKGNWKINDNKLQINASERSSEYLFIESENQYSKVNMDIIFTYQKSETADMSKWDYARGFGIIYAKDDTSYIEFRYLPDVKQLSMYSENTHETTEFVEKNVTFKENEPITFSVSINNGLINWKVNDHSYFELINTPIKNGSIRLINYNNELKINIDKFQLCYNYKIE